MSTAVFVDVRDRATPVLARLEQGIARDRVAPVIGRAARNFFVNHFRQLNRERPNALGGSRTNFYLGAARGTQFRAVGDGVIIATNHVGIALRYFGGVVRPVHAKYLTIPARAEAHGKRASEFDGLVVLWNRSGPYALARSVRTAIGYRSDEAGHRRAFKRGLQGGEILYWLKKEVTQKPDATVLPEPAKLADDVMDNVTRYVDQLTRPTQEYNDVVRRIS